MIMLRDWDVTSVALRLAQRWGDEAAIEIAERRIRKWAESEAPSAAKVVVQWVKVKAILLSLSLYPQSVH